MALAYLTGSVTQGSNDAFASAEVATALSGIGNISFRVRELLFEVPRFAVGDDVEYQLAICRRDKTSFPLITDRDVIASLVLQRDRTTSGAYIWNRVYRYTFTEDDDVRIVEDPLYLVIDTDSTSAQNSGYVRIGYERANISAVDRLTLLTQSLES